MSNAVAQQLRESLAEILPKYPVALAYLYGSQAAGNATPLSDVDIALVTESSLPGRERLRLELSIELELVPHCTADPDVRVINDAPLAVRGEVVQTGIRLYVKDDDARMDFEEYVIKRYLDFLPVLRQYDAAFFTNRRAELKEKGLF